MADNVLILGAGFSYDAGVPLMGSFVERMWEIARRGKEPIEGKPLGSDDQKLLNEATRLIGELDTYHGRANFDDRNIEDLLSILVFRSMAGGKGSRSALETMTQAIARTIELTCRVRDRGLVESPKATKTEATSLYRSFWLALLKLYQRTGTCPAIVTFNYDLVLERSLVELVVGTDFNPHADAGQFPVESFRINYFNKRFTCPTLQLQDHVYDTKGRLSAGNERRSGYRLVAAKDKVPKLDITLLKLHGSLNFEQGEKDGATSLEASANDPQILPPLFTKDTTALGSSMWAQALKELRGAKNVVVVGYSLPRTDIYMQYFLRAALGPNTDLNKIAVFDPALFEKSAVGEDLRRRYQECFSPQLQRRIDFAPRQPVTTYHGQSTEPGTTAHFVSRLEDGIDDLLFI